MNQNNNRKVTLLIDGAYFSHSTLHGERISNKELTMHTNLHYMQWEMLMIRNLLSTIRSFKHSKNDVITNVILCFDSDSWRKKVKPHKPYYVDEGEPLGYKAKRAEKKKESDIDYFGFDQAQNDFAQMIKGYIPTLKVDGLEADDIIHLASKELTKDPNNHVIILATDGDMCQNITDNVHYLKDVRKGNAKNGELYLSENNFNLLFRNFVDTHTGASVTTKSMSEMFFERMNAQTIDFHKEDSILKLLKGINSVQTTGDVYRLINRLPNEQAFVETKYKDLFYTVVCGDANLKDNIFPLFRWKSTTGTRNYRTTEKHVLQALEMCMYDKKPDTFYKELLSADDEKSAKENLELMQFIISLLNVTKQEGKARDVFKHLIHNIKMNTLDSRYIPQINQEWFKESFNELDLSNEIDVDFMSDELMKKDIGQHHSGGNLMTESMMSLDIDDLNIESNIDIPLKNSSKNNTTHGFDLDALINEL